MHIIEWKFYTSKIMIPLSHSETSFINTEKKMTRKKYNFIAVYSIFFPLKWQWRSKWEKPGTFQVLREKYSCERSLEFCNIGLETRAGANQFTLPRLPHLFTETNKANIMGLLARTKQYRPHRTMGIVTLPGITDILRNEVSDPVRRVKTETPVFPFFPKRVV